MISLKSRREIQIMQEASDVLKQVFRAVHKAVGPGVTTAELDEIAEQIILKAKGKLAFKGYRGYPKCSCISVNEVVVHGIPGARKLEAGDIVSFDVGIGMKGYFADAARTWPVGPIDDLKQRLIQASRGGLEAGIGVYKQGCHLGDLSWAIQNYVESRGFQVIRDYVGHGIGRLIHEEPQVPNYGRPGQGPRVEAGLVLAIEPMVTAGHYAVEVLEDGWTVVTRDRRPASHHEDMIAFTEDGFINLTADESAAV